MQEQCLRDQYIIDCLNTYYGIKVTILIFLPLGADENAATYKAQTKDFSYFIKIKHGHHEIGTIIQALLHANGIKQILSPIKTLNGQSIHYIDGCTLAVYPFIEGQDGFRCDLTNDQWVTLGKALRQIHAFDAPLCIKSQIKQEVYSSQWREAVRAIYTIIDDALMHDDIALKLLLYMKEHREIIHHLVDHADQLAQKIQKQSSHLVLCHSDIHAGNVLIAKDTVLYIVDWDQPIMAPKERDLMFIGGGVANVWNKQYEEDLFYKGYGETVIDRDILIYYRHERIVEDIAVYAQHLLLTNAGAKNRSIMYKHFIDMFKPDGVVDRALQID